MKDKTFNREVGRLDKIFIDDPRRAIVIGSFILVAIILLVIFWSRIKKAWNDLRSSRAASSTLKEHENETGETTSLTNASYYQYANQLYNAFRPHIFGWGTDEDAVYNVFNNMNNTADVLRLVQEFGVKGGMDLQSYMRSELSAKELQKVNGILSSKGITYSF